MSNDILQEQLHYYRARATEYDVSVQALNTSGFAPEHPAQPEWQQIVQAVRALGSCGSILELAAGTGLWSQELKKLTPNLTVLDGSAEMLEITRAKINDSHVQYLEADLFTWEPTQQYDLVFFAFWLSHVPPEQLDAFLDKLPKAVAPHGRLFIVDEPAGGQQISGPVQAGKYQQRSLCDGRTFNIVKVYYEPQTLQQRLQHRGFVSQSLQVGNYFFHLISTR